MALIPLAHIPDPFPQDQFKTEPVPLLFSQKANQGKGYSRRLEEGNSIVQVPPKGQLGGGSQNSEKRASGLIVTSSN